MTAEENFLLTVASHLEHRPLKKATKEEMRTVFSINRFPIDSIFFPNNFQQVCNSSATYQPFVAWSAIIHSLLVTRVTLRNFSARRNNK